MRQYVFLISILFIGGCGDDSSSQTAKDTALVYINSGAIQCEYDGMTTEETADVLTNSGIDVLESACATMTGLAVMAVCGAGTTNINVHSIPSANVADAEEIGFANVSTLKNEFDSGYLVSECRSNT